MGFATAVTVYTMLYTLIIVTDYPTQTNLSGVTTLNGLYSATDGACVLSFTPPLFTLFGRTNLNGVVFTLLSLVYTMLLCYNWDLSIPPFHLFFVRTNHNGGVF